MEVWHRDLGGTAKTDMTGVSHDFTMTFVAGNVIFFKVDVNGEPSYVKTFWISTIALGRIRNLK